MTTKASGCICGNEWMITTPIIYGGVNHSIDCNGCFKVLKPTQIIYHCTNIDEHPNGYDLCYDCHSKQLSNEDTFRCDYPSIGEEQTTNATTPAFKHINDKTLPFVPHINTFDGIAHKMMQNGKSQQHSSDDIWNQIHFAYQIYNIFKSRGKIALQCNDLTAEFIKQYNKSLNTTQLKELSFIQCEGLGGDDIIYFINSSNSNASKEETLNNSFSCYDKLFVTKDIHQKYNDLETMEIEHKYNKLENECKNMMIQNEMTDLNERNDEMELEKEYGEILNERNNYFQKCLSLQEIICKNKELEKEQQQDMKSKLDKLQKKYDELLYQYKILDEKCKSQKDAFNNAMQEKCDHNDAELRNLRVELNKQYEKQLKQREDEWREAKDRCIATLDESYGQLIEDKEKRINGLFNDIDELNNDLNVKVSEYMELAIKYDAVQQKYKNMEYEMVIIKDKYGELQQQYQCKTKELEKCIKNRYIKIHSLQHKNDELLSKQQAMENRISMMSNSLEEYKELETDRNEWIDQCQEIQCMNNELQHTIECQRNKMNKIREKCHLLEMRNSNVLASHDAKQRELDELGGKYKELVDKVNEEETETIIIDLNEGKECIVCMADGRTNAFVPCGHLCVCDGCRDECYDETGTCPLCKQKYRAIQKIYT